MATSGSKSVTVTSHNTLKFSWSLSSQSTTNNTSTISWKMQLISDSGGRISSSASKDWKVVINGKTYSGTNTIGIGASTTKTLASGTTTITHNADGTKSFSYSFSQEFAITFSGSSIGTKSGSGTGTLTTIPRASTVSCTSANIGANATITISRKSSGFTHTLTYTFGSLSGTIATKTTSTSISWTLPTSFYAQITNAKSKTGTITCTTYNGSTNIGSKSCSFTAKVSSGNAPTINPTIEDVNAMTVGLTGDSNTFIKYYSRPSIDMGSSAKNGATIVSRSCKNAEQKITTETGTMMAVGSKDFVFVVKDSRGFTTTKTVTVPFVDYLNPTCNLDMESMNANGDIDFTVSGLFFNGSFGAVNNGLIVEYRYKKVDEEWSNWTSTTYNTNGNSYNADVSLSGLDYKSTYVFEARCSDEISSFTTAEIEVNSKPLFNWGKEDFEFNINMSMANGKAIYGCDTNGDLYQVITPQSENNNLAIGYGLYENNSGYTHIYGSDVRIFSANAGNVWYKPYYSAGDTITGILDTSGYVSSGSSGIYFTIPLDKPILGEVSINMNSSTGVVIRQNNKYTHGSDNGVYAKPSSYSVTVTPFGLKVALTMSKTTDAINNAPCGIRLDAKIVLS